jgi:hypothetical protein
MLRSAAWLTLILASFLGFILLVARPVVAVACPWCFGLEKAVDGVYVEAAMPADARQHALQLLGQAEERVGRFYSGMQYTPRTLICATPRCFERIGGGGTRVGSLGSLALLVAPEGINVVLMSHELSHVELHGRVGLWHMELGAVPAWFDEGMAVLVSDDPQYLAPARHGRDRCAAGPQADMPADPAEWRERLAENGDLLYASAACQVDLWMIAQGGPTAVPALLVKLHDGQSFDALYKPGG